jgi:hypothetical protein
MKKLFFILSLTAGLMMLAATPCEAQYYKTAAGARLGYPLSASLKYFVVDDHALELYAGMRWFSGYSWTSISGAYQIHRPLGMEGLESLRWYFGGGASVLFWNFNIPFADRYATTTVGVQGYLGLDFAVPGYPLNISVDWVPTFFINGYTSGFGAGYGSLGVRYILSPKP